MSTAIFGISNSGLNLVVSLLVLMVVVVWLALIVYTYLDARRRLSDPFLVACATVGSFFPYIGTAVYAIVRPPEFLEDAHERELEIKAAELRVRQLTEASCPNCEFPIEKSFLRCPKCQRRLKDPCGSCGKPVDPRWSLCPYCETPLARRERERERPTRAERQPPRRAERDEGRESRPKREERPAPKRQPAARKKAPPPDAERQVPAAKPKRPQRSPEREPDPDPRQA
ncbi:MAG TPA: zinc ribbon domain-containing protein [Solirubrobacterales bacterium]|nr:zinc ribbon domain-containing protein [Solirubrobacterales bacterium]